MEICCVNLYERFEDKMGNYRFLVVCNKVLNYGLLRFRKN